MTKLVDSNMYTFNLSTVYNPSMVGVTPAFNFRALTLDGREYFVGAATVTIYQPNNLSAVFSPNWDYYKSNLEAVEIWANYTNPMQEGDYFLITFTSNAYSLAPAPSQLDCPQVDAHCTS